MMQSRRPGNEIPVTPQRSPQGNLIKSAHVDGNTDAQKLAKGGALYQIFSYSTYIFKVSSTFEKLYRYGFDPLTNEVVEILVFKRVRDGDPEMLNLRNKNPKRRQGTSTLFCNTRYDVYGLSSDGYLRGYMLYARTTYGSRQTTASEKMYFVYEKSEKKRR